MYTYYKVYVAKSVSPVGSRVRSVLYIYSTKSDKTQKKKKKKNSYKVC